MPLIFDSVYPTDIIFNSTHLTEVVFNGTSVWKSTRNVSLTTNGFTETMRIQISSDVAGALYDVTSNSSGHSFSSGQAIASTITVTVSDTFLATSSYVRIEIYRGATLVASHQDRRGASTNFLITPQSDDNYTIVVIAV